MDEPVQDGVGEGGLVDHGMPGVDGKLAGDDRRSRLIAILEDFHQIPVLAGGEPVRPPIVQDEQIGFDQLAEDPRECAG